MDLSKVCWYNDTATRNFIEKHREELSDISSRYGRKFCVSDFRQNQEWRCGNGAESGELPLGDFPPGSAPRYAREHISDIPLGTLEWVHDIDELDGELCSFDAKDSPAVKTVLPISLIRNRPSEGEQWADTLFLILRDGEFAGTRQEAEALLRMRIGDYLMTPEGWKSVKEASCDFNWGDLINLLPLPQYGILGHDALITAVSRRTPAVFRDSGDYATLLPYETISVDQDELLAPDNVDAKAYLYGPDDVLLAEVDASIDFQDGNILFEHSDVWAVIDHTTRGKVVLNGNEFELDANEMLQRLA